MYVYCNDWNPIIVSIPFSFFSLYLKNYYEYTMGCARDSEKTIHTCHFGNKHISVQSFVSQILFHRSK